MKTDLFQSCCHCIIFQICWHIECSTFTVASVRIWNRSVSIPIPKKDNAKECSNYHTMALISHANKIMLKILQARLQQYMNWELPDIQVGFRKGRGTRDQIANMCCIIKKAREFQKNIYFRFIDYAKAFVWITTNWKILQEMGIPYLPPNKSVCRSWSTS